MYKYLSLINIILALLFINNHAELIHVGSGYDYENVQTASQNTTAGDTILIHSGTYEGGQSLTNVKGTSENWIYIVTPDSAETVFSGSGEAWHITDAEYLYIYNVKFELQQYNGINIDDGGSYDSPSKHVVFDNCAFEYMNSNDNADFLKMSGVDSFIIKNCSFNFGSGGGSAIDMVGCHNGEIKNCMFTNMTKSSIQIKGGSRFITVKQNFLKNAGERGLNIGGSTGLDYFRPDTAHYEAANIYVYSNIFIGCQTPIAFVGSINSEVVNNTIYMPDYWVMRILQETVDPDRFEPCSYNKFINNIVYIESISTECNVGSNTEANTFTFSNNLWYNKNQPGFYTPNLPVTETNSITAVDPLFNNASSDSFVIAHESPAIENGLDVDAPIKDYFNNDYENPRSIGAIEGLSFNTIEKITKTNLLQKINVYPNPCSKNAKIEILGKQNLQNSNCNITCYNIKGVKVYNRILPSKNGWIFNTQNLPAGFYIIKSEFQNKVLKEKVFILK